MNSSKTGADTSVDTYMDYLFEVLGLDIREEWRADVKRYFMLSAGMAKVLEAHPLEMTEALAPVFHP